MPSTDNNTHIKYYIKENEHKSNNILEAENNLKTHTTVLQPQFFTKESTWGRGHSWNPFPHSLIKHPLDTLYASF